MFRTIEIGSEVFKRGIWPLSSRTEWQRIDLEDILVFQPSQEWVYDSSLGDLPILACVLPAFKYEYVIIEDAYMYPTTKNGLAEVRIVKRSYVGHDHVLEILRSNPTYVTSGGLDRPSLSLRTPIIVPINGCSMDPTFDDGIHIVRTNADITMRFKVLSLMINVCRRDYFADTFNWDFVDPSGNAYDFSPCDNIWNNYASWSGTGTSEVTVWCGRVQPPVLANTIGVILSAYQSASATVTGSYVKVQVSLDGSTWTDLWSVTPLPTSETMYRVRSNNQKVKWIRVVANPNSSTDTAYVKVYNVVIWV